MAFSIRRIFIGPRGLRAGWRLLLFLAVGLAGQFALSSAIDALAGRLGFNPGDDLSATTFLLQDLSTLLVTLGATLLMAKIEGRSLRQYGIPGADSFDRQFWQGIFFGGAAVTLLIGAIALTRGYSIQALNLHGAALLHYALLWAAASLMIGFTEEFLFRGYLQFTLADGIGFWPAAFVISFLFGALHFFSKPDERWTDWASTALLALFVCLTLRRTGSLKFAIGMHAAFDYFAIFIFSGPNGGRLAVGRLLQARFDGPVWKTGGSLGPEASWFIFPVLLLMFLGFVYLYPKPHRSS
jgi:membrane protease YdiL (CAAX protease family)